MGQLLLDLARTEEAQFPGTKEDADEAWGLHVGVLLHCELARARRGG